MFRDCLSRCRDEGTDVAIWLQCQSRMIRGALSLRPLACLADESYGRLLTPLRYLNNKARSWVTVVEHPDYA